MTAQLEGDEYREALGVVQAAFGIEAEGTMPEPRAITLDDLPQRVKRKSPRLVHLRDVSGIGLVPEGQTLKFAPTGLTLVYGANAARKSTYVRILKRLCRAVDRESELHGNVFNPPQQNAEPRCAVVDVLTQDGVAVEHKIDLSNPSRIGLEPVSVFDARCAQMYVTQQNVVAYVPSELLLLSRLAATQDRMRATIDSELLQLSSTAPDLTEFGCSHRCWRSPAAAMPPKRRNWT